VLIEIKGPEFVNKGSELMIHAILQKLSRAFKEIGFAMKPSSSVYHPYTKRAELGLYQIIHYKRFKTRWDFLANIIMPKDQRLNYGLVTDDEIDVILDASGFGYSDQWGPEGTEEMAKFAQKMKQSGKKVILLPQAFGPFKLPRSIKAFKTIVESADLIYPRDNISYEYISSLVGDLPHIKVAPDFTNLVEGKLPEYFNHIKHKVCIVPNQRMVDKTSTQDAKNYLPFLIICAKMLSEKGTPPFILIHEGDDDYELGIKIQKHVNAKIDIIREVDPLYIKGILGACQAVISSRYHGLVSALSKGVPCLGTGWSHKYQMLFEDYNCPECLLTMKETDDEILEKLALITDKKISNQLKDKINKAAKYQMKLTNNMWDEVIEVIQAVNNK